MDNWLPPQDSSRLPLNQSVDEFVREALAHNISIDLMNHPEGQHSFDMLDDNARSREIIRATLEFIKAHLLKETR